MPGPRARPSRVLLGEEEPLVRDFIREALLHSGYEVEVGQDEEDVLRRYRERAFGLLILDYDLARRSAFRGLMEVREGDATFPIILMAGRARIEPIAYTYRVHLLRKPFGAKGLRAAVDRAMPREAY